MIRRLIVPVLLIAVAIGAALQAQRTDADSDPGVAPDVGPPDFVVGTPMLSVRRTPEWLRQPLADNLLESEVRAANLTRVTPPDTCIVTHRDGEVIASIKSEFLLVPASNQKILTAAAILELAPPSDTFTTEVVLHRVDAQIIEPEVEEGAEDPGKTLAGDLWLIGGGDPVLATPAYINRFLDSRAYTDMTVLADSVAEWLSSREITTVSGAIIADETKYDVERDYSQEPFPTGETDENGDEIFTQVWKQSHVDDNQAGPLSALMVNDGYTSWPEDPLLRRDNVRAEDPAVAAAETLRNLLAERGIVVEGASVNGEAPPLSQQTSMGLVESPQLGEIVARMLTYSDNTVAELILKEIGVRTGVTSFRARAVEGMRDTLVNAGYSIPDEIRLIDGSGLSSLNQIRCTLIMEILDRAGPDSPLVTGLAVVGETGTVKNCLPGRTDVNDISAKTGTLNDVTAFSGVRVADNGDVLTFAMLANGEGVGITLQTCDLGEEIQNEIQLALIDAVAGHPYGPELTELEPLNPVGGR